MTAAQFKEALLEAEGDAEDMLSACFERIDTLAAVNKEALEMLRMVVYLTEADRTTYLLPFGIAQLIAKLENVE